MPMSSVPASLQEHLDSREIEISQSPGVPVCWTEVHGEIVGTVTFSVVQATALI